MGDDSSSDVAASALEDEDPSVTAVADEPAVTRERAPEVKPGDLLAGRYQIEAVLGKGGSGVVLRAYDRVSATVVAVKVLKPGLTHDPRWEKRFQRELRLGRPVRHPNVCRIFDIGDSDGYRFLTMEYATGGTLRDLIKKNQPLRPLAERLADAAGVIAGLAAIHGAGIVHRDVKPDNVLRMDDGRLVLSDFGLATDLPDSTMVSVFVGTPHYMAPEVREGDPATTRSDVWSLGVVLHEIFFGKRPEKRSVRSGSGVARSTTASTSSTVERAMLALCTRCLADDPADRSENAGAVQRMFESARRSPGSILRSRTRYRSLLLAAGVTGLVAVATIGLRSRRALPGLGTTEPGIQRVAPTGDPADWTKVATQIASFPGPVHCFSIVGRGVARVIWGKPQIAEDVDIASGSRKLSLLAPETYRVGCPQLSPDGGALLFASHTLAGASEVRLSNAPDGSKSRTITPGTDPRWLRNGQEFVYDIDASHAAVFSLPTMGFVLLADPRLGGHQMIVEKAVSSRSDLVGIIFATDNAQLAVSIYEGHTFDHRGTLMVANGYHLQFDPSSDDLLIPFNQSASFSTLTSLDWRTRTARHIGRYPGLEVVDVAPLADGMVVLARKRSKDVWLRDATGKRRLTTDGENFSAALSPGGDLLVSKRAVDGRFSLWRESADGTKRQVTRGPDDVHPDFAPDGQHWAYVDYSNKSIMLCATEGCRVLRRDEMLPTWPTFSPDGEHLAYVTQIGTPRLMVVSLKEGTAKPIGPMHWQCPPMWSSPEKLWSFEGAPGSYYWAERDAGSGATTGKRVDVGTDSLEDGNCRQQDRRPDSRFDRRVQIETEENSKLLRL